MATTPDDEELLDDIKSMIGETAGGDFSVDDILAEYGRSPRGGAPTAEEEEDFEPTPPQSGKILSFPTARQLDTDDADEDEDDETPEIQAHEELEDDPLAAFGSCELHRERSESQQDDDDEEDFDEDGFDDEPDDDLYYDDDLPYEGEDNVVDFPVPEKKGMLAGLIRFIDRQANKLFATDEEIGSEEVQRLERLIPGTDQEEEYEEERESIFQRLRREPPPPEDIPPRELARKYHESLFSLRLRGVILLFFSVLGLLPMVLPLGPISLPSQLTEDPTTILWVQVALLGVGMVLSLDLMFHSLVRGAKLRFGADSLLTVAAFVTLADGIYLALHPVDSRPLSYCSIALIALWTQLHGAFHKRTAQRISCHTAARVQNPYLVTLDEKKWNAKDTYCKWSGTPEGFGSQIQMDDGAQRFFAFFCPLLLLACIVIVLSRLGGEMGDVLWTASAVFLGATALGAPLCYGRTARKLEERLEHSGATLAGWSGAKESRKGDRVLLTDQDLFPTGSIRLKQPSFYHDHADSKVVAYTTCLITAANCGLTPVFEAYLRSYGGIPRKVESPLFHEGGGISGQVWHDNVLVGSASFMNLMGVPLKAGMHVNQAVFCAVNGQLAGMFPLEYGLHNSISPAVYTLLGARIAPVLATRDFNLIPAFLSGNLRLPAEDMDFPVVERRRELSNEGGEHNGVLTAVLCREGLLPFSEAVVAAKRLRVVTRVGALACLLGSVIGLLLMSYLTSMNAYSSASPFNLLISMAVWLIPVWCLTEWSHRF